MISAENARALMERKFIDTVEQKIIKAATSGYGDVEVYQEDPHDTDIVRACLEAAGYKVEQHVFDENNNIVSWLIKWSE